MSRPAKANDFLSKMKLGDAPAEPPAARSAAAPTAIARPARGGGSSRAGLKHIGAYLDREAVEKIALLRARLDLDNSQLIKLAVERLYASEGAKRKFGDA
jgi:hypothetical protein